MLLVIQWTRSFTPCCPFSPWCISAVSLSGALLSICCLMSLTMCSYKVAFSPPYTPSTNTHSSPVFAYYNICSIAGLHLSKNEQRKYFLLVLYIFPLHAGLGVPSSPCRKCVQHTHILPTHLFLGFDILWEQLLYLAPSHHSFHSGFTYSASSAVLAEAPLHCHPLCIQDFPVFLHISVSKQVHMHMLLVSVQSLELSWSIMATRCRKTWIIGIIYFELQKKI